MNEPQFHGHFPERPIMPSAYFGSNGTGRRICSLYPEENRGKLPYFGGMDNVKFKRPVIPGDQLIMKSEIVKIRGEFGRVHCEAYVDDQLAAQGDFTFALQKSNL